MVEIPETAEGLLWIAQHGPAELTYISGVQPDVIAAAGSGDQQALAHVHSSIQHQPQSTGSAMAHGTSPASPASPSAEQSHCTPSQSRHSSACSRAADLIPEGRGHRQQKEPGDAQLPEAAERLFQQAVLAGQLAAMKWLQALCSFPIVISSPEPMKVAAARGNLSMLKYLRSEAVQAPWDNSVALAAVPEPHCLRWLLSQVPPCPFDVYRILSEAIAQQDTETIPWLLRIDSFHMPWRDGTVCTMAAQCSDLLMLRWLRSQAAGVPAGWSSNVSYAAAWTGNLPMLQWLWAQEPACPGQYDVVLVSILRNHLHVLRWLRGRVPRNFWDATCATAAAEKGNLPLLQWLLEEDPPCRLDPMCLVHAAYLGHLPMLEYLVSRGGELGGHLYYDAADEDQFHICKWLHDQNAPRSETFPSDIPRMGCCSFGTPALMLLADFGCPLLAKDQMGVVQSRRTFCTLYGLLRWCRHATSGGATDSFNRRFSCGPGQQLLISLSSLPLELINTIAAMADLQHNISL